MTDVANVQGWTAKSKPKSIKVILQMLKRAGHLLWSCAITVERLAGSPANLAFLFDFDKVVIQKKLPDKRFTNVGGEKASVVPALE